ncbi:MAG: hypothetical protein LBV58_01300 [Acholeplasmatales bacterium]|jgi:hypothetical protein|nr:hypothetical protein [Acholeplasmatales bacterium]
MSKKGENKIKLISFNLFSKFFGFERGIDLTNEIEVLHRKNVVIKNISFVLNLVYSLMMFMVCFLDNVSSNWIHAVVAFLVTFILNYALKRLINEKPLDATYQNLACALLPLNLLVCAILSYWKFYTPSTKEFEVGTYMMILLTLLVVSLYQNKKVLSVFFVVYLAILTGVHILLTYNIVGKVNGQTMLVFLKEFTHESEFYGLLLRTIIFILFYVLILISVSLGEYLQEERKKELLKRIDVQKDFDLITSKLFDVALTSSSDLADSVVANDIASLAKYVGTICLFSENEIKEVVEYSKIHLRFSEIKEDLFSDLSFRNNFDDLKENSKLALLIAQRLQLEKKVESVARAVIESVSDDKDFIARMTKIQPNKISNVIFISDLYITFRSNLSYKRAITHQNTINAFHRYVRKFVDEDLFTRFIEKEKSIEELYKKIAELSDYNS